MKKLTALLITLCIFVQPVFAEKIYLQAKDYLDVETGRLVQPANLVIENGKIEAINPSSAPKDAVVVSKPNLTLLPGLMDAHVHITCDLSGLPTQVTQNGAGLQTLRGAKNANKTLMAGFTTVRDLGQCYPGVSFVTVDLARASDLGWIAAPHIIAAGHALSITGGHMDFDTIASLAPGVLPVSYKTGVADGKAGVLKATRYQIKYGAKVIKIMATAGVLSQEEGVANQQFSDEEMKTIVDEAHRHGVPVAAHAHGTQGINAAIKAGVDSIEHGSLVSNESIKLMKQHGTFLVPTTHLLYALDMSKLTPVSRKKAQYLLPLAKKNLANAFRNNVKVAFGTDAGVYPHGENAKEFTSLTTLGMSTLDAIRAATVNAAALLKVKDRGVIKKGYEADIIGVAGNPLHNVQVLEKVKFVMKDGTIYKG